jgi:uncharacterized protein (DUF3084 family)
MAFKNRFVKLEQQLQQQQDQIQQQQSQIQQQQDQIQQLLNQLQESQALIQVQNSKFSTLKDQINDNPIPTSHTSYSAQAPDQVQAPISNQVNGVNAGAVATMYNISDHSLNSPNGSGSLHSQPPNPDPNADPNIQPRALSRGLPRRYHY